MDSKRVEQIKNHFAEVNKMIVIGSAVTGNTNLIKLGGCKDG